MIKQEKNDVLDKVLHELDEATDIVCLVWLACISFAATLVIVYGIGNIVMRAVDWIGRNI